MRYYRHKINEGFSDVFNSSLSDYSKGFEDQDIDWSRGRVERWMNKFMFTDNYHAKPCKRWKLKDDLTIPSVVAAEVYLKLNIWNGDHHDSALDENGEIPDYIKINKISGMFNVSSFSKAEIPLKSFKRFPKTVTYRLTLDDASNELETLEGIPVVDVRGHGIDKGYNNMGCISLGACNKIWYKYTMTYDAMDGLLKELLTYCDFIPNDEHTRLRIDVAQSAIVGKIKYYPSFELYYKDGHKWIHATELYDKDYWLKYHVRRDVNRNYTLDDSGNLIEWKEYMKRNETK